MVVDNRLGFLGLGCILAGAILWGTLSFNKSALVDLTGSILKVRTQQGPDSTMVVVDFRITNPSRVPFVVNSAEVIMDPGGGAAPVPSTILSKSDVAVRSSDCPRRPQQSACSQTAASEDLRVASKSG